MGSVSKADWAALVPWDGIQNKPPFVDGPNGNITIADVKGLQAALDSKQSKGELAKVAYSGSYKDLNNTPDFGSAAFADVSDFMPARTPSRWQMAEFTFTSGFYVYDVSFSQAMVAIPTVKCQVLMSDSAGEAFFAVVEEDLITTTGFRVWLSGVPSTSAGKLRWWAEVETSFGGSAVTYAPTQPETTLWAAAVVAAGGTLLSDSETIANDLVTALKSKSYYSKIVYLLPLLGGNAAASFIPLLDPLHFGNPTNSNFVNGDFSQSTGLMGNATNKRLNMPFPPGGLGLSGNAGIGFWANNVSLAAGTQYGCGAFDNTGHSSTFGLRFGNTSGDINSQFYWGASTAASYNFVRANSDYYGQRSSPTSRKLFKDGILVATNTTSDVPPALNDLVLTAYAVHSGTSAYLVYWGGGSSVIYFTDGTLADADVLDLHNTLNTYLITPTGR